MRKKKIEKPTLGKCMDCIHCMPKDTKSLKGEFFMGSCEFWTTEVMHPNFYFLDHECENGNFKHK